MALQTMTKIYKKSNKCHLEKYALPNTTLTVIFGSRSLHESSFPVHRTELRQHDMGMSVRDSGWKMDKQR